MARRISLAIALSLIIGSFPALATVCDLRCGGLPDVLPEASQTVGNDHSGPSESCPFHSESPASKSTKPCRERSHDLGPTLLPLRSSAHLAAPQASPAQIQFSLPQIQIASTSCTNGRNDLARSHIPSLRSILRV